MAQMGQPQTVDDPGLPPEWNAVYDPSSGLTYYWNRSTNDVTYTRPGGFTEAGGAQEDDAEVPDRMQPPEFTSGSQSAQAYRSSHEMTVQGQDIPDPVRDFRDAGFPDDVLQSLEKAGFSEPTPIQSQCWPVAQSGRDLVGIAKTGSGKTLGYMLPGMLRVRNAKTNPRMGPQALVLAPTRELANQIKDETEKYLTRGISCTCLFGGQARGPQKRALEFGPSVVIATPGRLNDFLEYGQVSLHQVEYLVLDEADRMLDMGFEPQIQRIVQYVPRERQTLFFSATWPKEVKKIASQFVQTAPVHVFIGSADVLVANKDITQRIDVVNGYEKNHRLFDFLRSLGRNAKVLIFCSTKKMCDSLSHTLNKDFGAIAIHGDKSQDARDHTLRLFKQGRANVMVATDVAARGLDIPDVDAVVNYDFPNNLEDYVHRIGRTARAGAKGTAYSFFSQSGPEAKYASGLCKIITDAGQTPPPELQQLAKTNQGGNRRPGSSMRFQASGGPPRGNPMQQQQGRPPQQYASFASARTSAAPFKSSGASAATVDKSDRDSKKDKDSDRGSRHNRERRSRSRSRDRDGESDKHRDRDRDRDRRRKSRDKDEKEHHERRERSRPRSRSRSR